LFRFQIARPAIRKPALDRCDQGNQEFGIAIYVEIPEDSPGEVRRFG
jgi:hypothetical protein